ncbi:hypothetical protein LIA77_00979 [Sarocladium implicatum]|nr:hypothetical protein LIA77_00979 [Sarocladium implicatum]
MEYIPMPHNTGAMTRFEAIGDAAGRVTGRTLLRLQPDGLLVLRHGFLIRTCTLAGRGTDGRRWQAVAAGSRLERLDARIRSASKCVPWWLQKDASPRLFSVLCAHLSPPQDLSCHHQSERVAGKRRQEKQAASIQQTRGSAHCPKVVISSLQLPAGRVLDA